MTSETGSQTGAADEQAVLYVGDPDDGIADSLGVHLPEGIALQSVPADAALSAAGRTEWSVLVVGDDSGTADRAALLSSVDCPTVLFTATDPQSVPDALLDRVDTLVERGNGDRSVAFLAEKVETLLSSSRDSVEDALAEATSVVESQAQEATGLFVVDDDGRVVWSNRSFEAVFPVEQVDASVPETTDFYDRLDAVAVDHDEGGLVTVDGGTAPSGEGSGAVPTALQTRYYVYDSHPIPAVGEGLTIERFDDVTERVRRETRSRLLELLVEQAQDGLYTLDHNGIIDFCNESFAANLGYEREELIGEHAAVTLAPGELETGQRTVQYLLDNPEVDSTEVDMTFQTRSGEHREMSIHHTLLPTADDTYGGLMGVVRDVTERRERERRIVVQRDELSMLNRTNRLIQDVIGSLGDVASRSELQQTVCDRLVETDRYELAWIGEPQGGEDVLVPLTNAGDDAGYLTDIEIRTDDTPAGNGPGGRAYQSGTVQVVSDVRTDESFAPWRERALDAGLESLVAIPLRHAGTTHGVLAVYADEPAAFSERLAEGFAVLGETIGLAVTAVQNPRRLREDATVSLVFRSRSAAGCLVWLAGACDCTLETAGAIETDDGVVQYLRVDGATPTTVVEAFREGDTDGEAQVTRSDSDSVVEIHTDTSLSVELSAVGASLESGTIRSDGARVVVEAPTDADVRAIRRVIEQFVPDVELVSKTERTDPGADQPPAEPLSALTDRQREVVRAAYLAGYYESPRETTAEELADSLGIAPATLHQHLGRAERNLFDALLDS